MNFTATGQSGTTAFVNLTIPKSAVPDINALQVRLNDTVTTPTITSDSTNYFIYFSFTFHSTYIIHIALSSPSNSASNPPVPSTIFGLSPLVFYESVAGLVAILVVAGGAAFFLRRRKTVGALTTKP